jgi:Protein of unknown function (DUF3667)
LPENSALSETVSDQALAAPACRNCGATLTGPFCSRCGQGRVGRITLRSFAHEVAAQLVEVDHGFLHTFVEMLRRPGAVIREYIDGRRRSYTSPVAYILIASALSLLRSALTSDAAHTIQDMRAKFTPTFKLIYNPARLDVFLRIQDLVTTNKFMMDAVILIPIALSLRFLFRKRGVNVAECAVFTCYTFGQATLLSVIIGTPLMLVARATLESTLFVILALAYLLYAGFGFFGKSFGTAARIIGAVALGVLLMNVVTYTLPFLLAR